MAESQHPADAAAEVEMKKLSELRVIDLKAELKKRNLDTGGNKSILIERLRKALVEEGENPNEIQVTTDTPNKKTQKRSGRVRKSEEGFEDNGLEDDSGDNQENEETSLEQENVKVLEILGESDKSEQLTEETPEVGSAVHQDDSYVTSEKTKEEEEVFVTIESVESADSMLVSELDEESNEECKANENKALGSDHRESKEQSPSNDTDFEMVDVDESSEKSGHILQNPGDNLEPEDISAGGAATGGEDSSNKKDTEEETSAAKVSSEKEDDQKMSSTDEADAVVSKDEKGQIDACSGRNLWVSGLSSTTRATDLKNLFSKYGKVVGAKVVTNARSPGARCYGFVTMSTPEDATKCINHLHRTELHGRMISVEKAKNEPAGKKSSDKDNETKKEKQSSSEQHSTEKSSSNKKDETSDKDDGKITDKDNKEEHKSDRSRTSKSGSRGTERTVVMDESKGEPVISVKTSSESKERSSKSHDRKSESKDKKEILSFDKIKEQRERERQRQREREIREMERQRERDRRVRERVLMVREREERERLRRERVRLEIERERLERERMERERLERERMRIEEERRIEQERIQREREELRRQQERLRYEQDRRSGVRRPYDMDARRDDPYWPESKRMTFDDRYRDIGRQERFNDFEVRDRSRYMDPMHLDRREESRSSLGARDDNYPDRHGRELREGWGDYDGRVHEGRGIAPPGRDGRDWGDRGRKMDDRSRPGDRGMPGPSGHGQMNRGGIPGNFLPGENSPSMSGTLGLKAGNFGGQNRPNDPRFTHRY